MTGICESVKKSDEKGSLLLLLLLMADEFDEETERPESSSRDRMDPLFESETGEPDADAGVVNSIPPDPVSE